MYCTEKGAHWSVTVSRDNNRYLELLLVYTGAGRRKITRLKCSQVRKDEATGRHYLMIAADRGKTDAAQR